MNEYVIPEPLLRWLVEYLAKQPYGEVSQAIAGLTQAIKLGDHPVAKKD